MSLNEKGLSNFGMETILEKIFAQVHKNHSMIAEGTSTYGDVCMSSCAKPLRQRRNQRVTTYQTRYDTIT